MRKVALFCGMLIICITVGLLTSRNSYAQNNKPVEGKELTKQSLENMEYNLLSWRNNKIFDRKRKLTNEESGDVHIVKIAFGDLNNDGKQDAAVILFEQGGASAGMDQVSAVINKNGKFYHVASAYLGDHVEIKSLFINDGNIIINMSSNPQMPPIEKRIAKFKLEGTKLIGPPGF